MTAAGYLPRMAVLDITTPYSRQTSFLYDRLIAPAVVPLIAPIEAEWATRLGPSARVLDVGCGGGQVAARLAADHPSYEVVGVDLSKDQVRRAQRRSPRLTFQVADALALPFPDGIFDGVYSIASLKHWPDVARGIAECARVVRPGGLLCLVEVERGCSFDDTLGFVRTTPLGRGPLLVPASAAFMAFVAGRGWHIDEARAAMATLPLDAPRIERHGGVALVLHGRKRL